MAGSSETNPGGLNGANGHGNGNGGPVRGMADVTRLFMTGARGGPRPVRVPPGKIDTPSHEVAKDQAGPRDHEGAEVRRVEGREAPGAARAERETAPVPELAGRKAVATLPAVMVVLGGGETGDGGGAMDGAVMAAKALAGAYGVAVGVVARDGEMLHVGRVAPMGMAEGGSAAATPGGALGVAVEAASEVRVARSLYCLRERVAHWLVALPGETGAAGGASGEGRGAGKVSGVDRRLLEGSADWVVVSGMGSDDVIACYRALKAACGAMEAGERRIRLMLRTGEGEPKAGRGAQREAAARVHARLNQVARDFLGQELMLTVMGDEAMEGVLAEAVATFDLAEAADGEYGGVQSVWESVVDFVRDLNGEAEEEDAAGGEAGGAMEEEDLGRVLEEGEREALMGEDRAAEPRTEPRGQGDTEEGERGEAGDGLNGLSELNGLNEGRTEPQRHGGIEDAEGVNGDGSHGAAAEAKSAAAALPVFEGSAWEVMERAAMEMVRGGVVLEARPPLGGRGLLMAERGGRIHLWCLVEAGGGSDGLGWAALWGWAREHRELIALTRRDLAIDARAEVAVHVVVAGGLRGGAMMGGASAGVRWYRMMAVRWAERTGLVVVEG